MDLLVLVRHAQSVLNVEGRVNGDPSLDRGLSDRGLEEARVLGDQIANLAVEVCVTSRFPRAAETARVALGERADELERVVMAALDDIRIGELEGSTLESYRAWRRGRSRDERFPGGESLNEAAVRYADAYGQLLDRAEPTVLCVCHEIPVRYALNAAAGSDRLDGPVHDVANATPFLFDRAALERAAEGIRSLAEARDLRVS